MVDGRPILLKALKQGNVGSIAGSKPNWIYFTNDEFMYAVPASRKRSCLSIKSSSKSMIQFTAESKYVQNYNKVHKEVCKKVHQLNYISYSMAPW